MLQPRSHGRGMSPGALAWRMRADAVLLSGARLRLLLVAKANFDPAQPRVPAGQAEGGQWTKVPGWAGSADTPPEPVEPGTALAQARPRGRGGGGTYLIGGRLLEATPGQAARLEISAAQANAAIARVRTLDPGWRPQPQATWTIEGEIAGNLAKIRQAEARFAEVMRQRPSVDTVEELADFLRLPKPPPPKPNVPAVRPATAQGVNTLVKQLSNWLLDPTSAGILDLVVDANSWIYDFRHYIVAYLDPPKTLAELQAAVAMRMPGYDVHHIVEKASARAAGFPASWIDGPDNLVLIPTLKHWQVTGWFMTPKKNYDGLSPRAYLKGKDWDERVRIGLEALVKAGVLEP